MKIGIDLDDTISNTRTVLTKFHNDTYGTNFSIKDITSYEFWEAFGITLKEYTKEINNFHKNSHFKDIEPIEGAREILEKIKKNNELYIITARGNEIRERTEKWIEEYFPNIFSKIYFTNEFSIDGTETTKGKICDDIGIDILIEDNLENILECIKPNRKAFLIDYPWNQTDKLPENIIRVYSWKEIGKLI